MTLPLITLLTDFGTNDIYVAAMKGAIYSVNPHARVVDLTHEITAHDVEEGAWMLLAAYNAFPGGTIHVAVVDPSVGSTRRAVLVAGRNGLFVAPDNGLLSYVIEEEKDCRFFHLTNERHFRPQVSRTFHGRDVFAPVAAWLAKGVAPAEFGEEIFDPARLKPLAPMRTSDGRLEGRIMHIDVFGNCITNIKRENLSSEAMERGAYLQVSDFEIRAFKSFFADGKEDAKGLFTLWGSADFLEVAAYRASAARILNAKRGDPVTLIENE
ncbi:MAG: SAM-dependent chlorinase/fluorinase [Pyrinomonadaceae bacterium]|nr:SAM-dependent chlorinase/fluorinase [Pyrinomonadaceae bacterium]